MRTIQYTLSASVCNGQDECVPTSYESVITSDYIIFNALMNIQMSEMSFRNDFFFASSTKSTWTKQKYIKIEEEITDIPESTATTAATNVPLDQYRWQWATINVHSHEATIFDWCAFVSERRNSFLFHSSFIRIFFSFSCSTLYDSRAFPMPKTSNVRMGRFSSIHFGFSKNYVLKFSVYSIRFSLCGTLVQWTRAHSFVVHRRHRSQNQTK